MSISPQQLQIDRNNFQTQAQKDGLNLQQIRQQAISTLPPGATKEQQEQAVQTATLQAVQKTGDQTLAQNYQQLQNDHAAMLKNGHGKKGHKPGGADGQDPVQQVIQEGDQATVSEIQSCLSGMKSNDPNYATLQGMLVSAQSWENKPGGQQQQPPFPGFGGGGNVINYMS